MIEDSQRGMNRVNVAGESLKDKQATRRLTFRQKFWLFGVGLPVLLMIGLLALAVILPKPLNPTERKLVGKWAVIYPADMKGEAIVFDGDYTFSVARGSSDSSPHTLFLWEADESSFTVTEKQGSVVETRIRLRLGYPLFNERYEVDLLTENELHIRSISGGFETRYRRVEAPHP